MRYHTTEARRLLEVTRAGLSGNGIEIYGLGETRDGRIILRGGLTLTAHSASQLPINMGGRGPASVGPTSERTVHFMQQANLASPAGFKSQLPLSISRGHHHSQPLSTLDVPDGMHVRHPGLFIQSLAQPAPDSSSRLGGNLQQSSHGLFTQPSPALHQADPQHPPTSTSSADFDGGEGSPSSNEAAAAEVDEEAQGAARRSSLLSSTSQQRHLLARPDTDRDFDSSAQGPESRPTTTSSSYHHGAASHSAALHLTATSLGAHTPAGHPPPLPRAALRDDFDGER
jgi:hypothetical protein